MATLRINSREAFTEWLRSSIDTAQYRFGRLSEPTTLTLSSEAETEDDPARAGRFVPITLPKPEEGMRWWDELWNREIVDYWLFRDWGTRSVMVAANATIWRPQDSLHAKLAAKDFEMVYDDEFRRLMGEAVAAQMHGEVTLAGVSVRVFSLSDADARKAMRHKRSR